MSGSAQRRGGWLGGSRRRRPLPPLTAHGDMVNGPVRSPRSAADSRQPWQPNV